MNLALCLTPVTLISLCSWLFLLQLVSENRGYLKQISEALTQLSSKKENSFKVYTCESVTQVLNVSDTPPIDYVAFCVNGNYINSLLEVIFIMYMLVF